MDETMTWLKEISEVYGPSGFESRVKELLAKRLNGMADVSYDNIGSIIFKKQGTSESPKIMLASHMDEIGFLVKVITKDGFIKFTSLGGWWEQVMLGQRVVVMGAKGDIHGVIGSKPPHILAVEERKKMVQKKDMYIDIGASDEKEVREKYGIRPGDAIVPYSTFTPLANNKFLMGKAWDNRIGCAIMAEVVASLQSQSHPNTLYGVGTVQEEVGLRGAKTSTAEAKPDIAIAIDTSIAGDTPGIADDQAAGKLGKGVGITIFDASMIPHTALRNFVIETAEQERIPYQLEFTEGGGTDAGRIHLHSRGVPSIVLSIPTRYIHSHNSVIHRDDYEAAISLLVALMKRLDENTYKQIIKGTCSR